MKNELTTKEMFMDLMADSRLIFALSNPTLIKMHSRVAKHDYELVKRCYTCYQSDPTVQNAKAMIYILTGFNLMYEATDKIQ